jgi:predicted dehydrogenase
LNLDAVYVITPIPSHYSVIKEVYGDKIAKNVFVEKTLSCNYDHSQELCKLAEHSKGANMVGYMKRFAVTFNQAKKLLEEEAIGKVTSFKAYAFSSDFSDAPQGSEASRSRGSVLEDLGSHVTDMALWYFGDFTVTNAKPIANSPHDALIYNVEGPSGLKGDFEVSWCKTGYRMPEFCLSIQGTNGSLKVNDDEVILEPANEQPQRWYRQNLGDNVGFMLGNPEFYRETKDFLESIVFGNETKLNFEGARKTDCILQQVRGKLTNE